MSARTTRCLLAAAMLLPAACGNESAEVAAGTQIGAPQGRSPRASAGRDELPEKTATIPSSPCDWIRAGEVAAVVGKLSGAPRAERGGCFYPLPVDSLTIARRARADSMRAALERAGLKSDWPAEPEDTGGVFVQVSVGRGAEERAAELAFGTMGSWIGDDSLFATPQAMDGWDYRRALPGKPNFMGRAGTVMVYIEGGTHGMKDSVLAILATRVRDRIPDLPFVDPAATNRAGRIDDRDPCSVLSRVEAENVLGKLVVAPYRVREGRALADPDGESCAYYSGRHRALVVTPYFVGAEDEMRFVRGRGGLGAIGIMDRVAEGADTLEGPWDAVAIGVEGELAMIKGNRLLKIAYLTSSTDLRGAIRLAGPALRSLAETE